MMIHIDEIDEGFDDVDQVIQFEVSDAERSISNNLLAIFNGTEYIGTAFIIDDKGTFISAGHNFRNLSIPHTLYWKNQELQYETIHIEYTEPHSYNETTLDCKDIYIGEIINFEDIPHSEMSVIKEMEIDPDLIVIGVKSSKIPTYDKEIIIEPIMINNQQLYIYYIKTNLTNPDNLASLPIHKGDLCLKHNNVRCLDFKRVSPCKYGGISGGPVCMDGKVIGMVIADIFITIDYILQLLPKSKKA